jgi:hypothetical protein
VVKAKRGRSAVVGLLLWGSSLGLLYVSMMTMFLGVMAPGRLVEPVVEPVAAAGKVARDEGLYKEIVERLSVAGRARLAPDEAVQLLSPWRDPELGRLDLTATEHRHLDIDLSHPLGTSWLNIELVARELKWADGRFERVVVEELSISGWDVSSVMGGQEISSLVNRRLGHMMRRHPHAWSMGEAISSMEWTGQHLVVEVHRDRLGVAFPQSIALR